MRARDLAGLALALVLGTAVAAKAARVASLHGGTRVELGRFKLTAIEEATRERLATLTDPVVLTYYVSARESMPSELRRLERDVTELLDALARASDGKLSFQVIDPDADEERRRFATRAGIAPFRRRTILRDAWSERTVWSSLAIAYGAYPPAAINGLTPEHLPRLQGLLVARLDQMERPRRPAVALAAPEGFAELEAELARRADVQRVDLAAGGELPRATDVLVWADPGPVGAAALRRVDDYLASGRSVVLAGGLARLEAPAPPPSGETRGADAGPTARFRVAASGFDAAALWSHFGLRPVDGLVLDRGFPTRVAGAEGEEPLSLPFLVRCIAPQQDFTGLAGQPNGTLFFQAPTPLALDPPRLTAGGWTPQVLATTSDDTALADLAPGPDTVVDARALDALETVEAPKQPLAVLLRPGDPWRGSVVALAASSPLRDGNLRAEGFAHRRLVDVLLRTLASDDRLVVHRARRAAVERVPELGPGARGAWLVGCAALLPLLFGAAALARGVFGRLELTGAAAGRRSLVLLAAGGVAAVLAVRGAGELALSADWTRGELSRLADETRALARDAAGPDAVRARLCFSRASRLPPELRPGLGRLEDVLGRLRRAGAELALDRVVPEDLAADERAALAEAGVAPFSHTSVDEGVTTLRTVFAALVLESGERREVLRFEAPSAFEDLEFRLAFALWRLATGRRPHVAFASDLPRLSPAEAHMDYQLKGLFAPGGADVYSVARRVLEDAGFRVTHVSPRDPAFPPEMDLLVWIQPRRDIRAMLERTVRYLHGGGKLLLCAQHFNMQSRQYRGRDFDTVYWPQPQFNDLDTLYFPEVGIELVREVLFDELKRAASMETQVNRDASTRDYERQDSALPFLLRAVAANFADADVTRALGDQAFTWANRLRWDEARLAELGIEAEALITTSDRAWSYAWKGGYLPPEVLEGREPEGAATAAAEGGELEPTVRHLGRVPLAARFRGRFPLPAEPLVERADEEGWPAPAPDEAAGPSAPGELVFVGCSELFKNASVSDPDFRADHLLLNAVAALALPPELAAVATRRATRRGFGFVEPGTRALAQWLVPAAAPALLLLLGALRLRAHLAPRRSRHRRRAGRES